MTKILGPITSLCPTCLQVLPANLFEDGDCVRLSKTCKEHGDFSSVIWRGSPLFATWHRPKIAFFGGVRQPGSKGCPFDCGLCINHRQKTCTALVELTTGCNLRCPVCFAGSGKVTDEPSLAKLQQTFSGIMAKTGGCNLQLSGGEPTIRRDLPAIVELARASGFSFIQVNSNGLQFARDKDLAPRLFEAGLSSVFLQFDGVSDAVYERLRGRPILSEKLQAIDNLAKAGIGIVLVPTLVPGVNIDEIYPIVRFALDHAPHVRGIHFQPISYFGRFPKDFAPNHYTLPELMTALAEQSQGLLDIADFHPPGCEHALCSFSAKYLIREDGSLQRLGTATCDCPPQPAEKGADTAIAVTARQWGPVPIADTGASRPPLDALDSFVQRARSHTFSISAMAFQDCWNVSLERLQGCCIHVAQPDGRLIPFCSFNLTSRHGQALHRRQPKK